MLKSAFGNIPADGAQQFAPFASLKGYDDMVHMQENQQINKPDLTEDDIARISHELSAISLGDAVRIEFWHSGMRKTLTDNVKELVPAFQTITVGKTKISFSDIYDIQRL